MTSDDKPVSPKARDKKDIDRIERLYKQADQAYGGFAESEPPLLEGSNSYTRDLTQQSDIRTIKTVFGDDDQSLTWVLNVLDDLASFAENQQIEELVECLKDAHRKVETILQKIEKP